MATSGLSVYEFACSCRVLSMVAYSALFCGWLLSLSIMALRFTHIIYLILSLQYVFVVVAVIEQGNSHSVINKIMICQNFKFHVLMMQV